MKGANQKLKLLYLKKILEEQTDSDHGLTMSELIDLLAKEDINAGHQGLYDDINCLRTFGMDIDYNHSDRTYRLMQKRYPFAATVALRHAVQSSTALDEEMTTSIQQQLDSEMSQYELQAAKRIHVLMPDVIKNHSAIEKLIVIQQAIDEKELLSFRHEWKDQTGKKHSMRLSSKTVYPLAIFFARNEYHLLCQCAVNTMWEERKYDICCFRIRDMFNLETQNLYPHLWGRIPSINITQYINNPFVFGGGKLQSVTLIYDKSVEEDLIHQFGHIDNPKVEDDTHSRATFPVIVNDMFFGWLFSLGDKVWIIDPVTIKRQFTKMLRTVKKPYKQKPRS